ncbi:MAG: OmpA family protein [Gammaproteobacteria bacterium]|nr:OmpA family protein [Gammaproteobacteria bacterium]
MTHPQHHVRTLSLSIFTLLALSPLTSANTEKDQGSNWSISALGGISLLSPYKNSTQLNVDNNQNVGFSLSLDYLWNKHLLLSGFYLDAGNVDVSDNSGLLGQLDYKYYGGSLSWMPFSARNTVSPYLKGGLHSVKNSASDTRILFSQSASVGTHLGAGAIWKFSPDWRLVVDLSGYGKDSFVASAGLRYQLFNDSSNKSAFSLFGSEESSRSDDVLSRSLSADTPKEIIKVDLGLSDAPFDAGLHRLNKIGEKIWSNMAEELNEAQYKVVELSSKNSQDNDYWVRQLAIQRAESVQSFLIGFGVAEKQIVLSGFNRNETMPEQQSISSAYLADESNDLLQTEEPSPELSVDVEPFDAYAYQLSHSAKVAWATIADQLIEHPNLHIELAGYTDTSGSDELNGQLAQQRAESVKEYLMSLGVNGDQISAQGYGDSSPIANNATFEGRKLNRRVEIRNR